MRRTRLTDNDGNAARTASFARRLRRNPLALAAPLVPALAAGIALAAGAPAKPAAPTIGAKPADPTNQTSAHFAYSDTTAGASFECELDGAAFAACPAAGTTYAGPLAEGKHTFKVRALTAGKTGSDESYSWTVDTTPPSAAVAFPVNGSALNSAAWGHGCPQGAGICGSAKDTGGVKAVYVSIRQGTGDWWGGSSFDQSSESFQPALLAAPGKNSSKWSYALALPADGAYTVHVRASDEAANATPAASQPAATFTIDTAPPPAPAITSGPEAQTMQRSATFAFADSEAGTSFLCSRDHKKFRACHSPLSYASNSRASHLFEVQARDAAGNTSPAASWSWSVVKTIEGGKPFGVTGNAGPLAPGVSSPVAVTVTNPNSVAITVTELNVAVAQASSNPGCEGPANLAITQSNVSASNPLVVQPGSKAVLPSGAVSAPQVLMKDLPTNQDACKNASFTFNYSGSAHS